MISRLDRLHVYEKPRYKKSKAYWYWFASWRISGKKSPVERYLGPSRQGKKISREEAARIAVELKARDLGLIGLPTTALVPVSEFSTDIRELLTCDLPEELRRTKLQVKFNQKKSKPKPKSIILKEGNGSFSIRKGKPRPPYHSGVVTFEDKFWSHDTSDPSERWEIAFNESEMAEAVLFVLTYNNYVMRLKEAENYGTSRIKISRVPVKSSEMEIGNLGTSRIRISREVAGERYPHFYKYCQNTRRHMIKNIELII
jgi:hypothetical protein